MKNVTTIRTEQFPQEVLRAEQPVLVDFYADWCPPCRALAPTLERLAAEYEGRVKIVKVNVDDSPELAREYDTRSIPTLILFRRGQVVDVQVGAPPARVLRDKLESVAPAIAVA
ncbi:MAG: thioredoxin [Acidobacteria bacterium]|nr:MAG: thioredoxin [Acidobacteriota bacterium]